MTRVNLKFCSCERNSSIQQTHCHHHHYHRPSSWGVWAGGYWKMLSLIVNHNLFKNVGKIKCFSKFNVKFRQIHTDSLIILIKWITLLIFITTTPLCEYFFFLYFTPVPWKRILFKRISFLLLNLAETHSSFFWRSEKFLLHCASSYRWFHC